MKNSIVKICSFLLLLSLSLVACSSNKEIPEGVSAKVLIQEGQNEYNRGRYNSALRFYDAVIERYGDDVSLYIEATYEIAHIYLKKKKYDRAEPLLNEILNMYPKHNPGELPPAYEKLAKICLEKIPHKEKN